MPPIPNFDKEMIQSQKLNLCPSVSTAEQKGTTWRYCQSNANQSPNSLMMRALCCQLTSFGQCSRAVLLEDVAAIEVTVEIEMVVDRGVNGGEFL